MGEATTATPQRPKGVRRFEILMYAGLAVTLAAMPFQNPAIPAAYLLEAAAWWTFIVLLVWLTARRRKNWARRTLFILFCLELVQFILFRDSLQPTTSLIYVMVTVLEAFAYYYVFTGDSREWFRSSGTIPANISQNGR